MSTEFRAWRRPGVHTTATIASPGDPRLTGHLKFDVTDDTGASFHPEIPFALAGPADAVGLDAQVVVKRYPAPGVADAEATKAPFIEVQPADIPWRYTAATPGGGGLRPWLVLVVGPAATMHVDGAGRLQVPAAVTAEHRLALSGRWAHTHPHEGGEVARLLSPVRLSTAVRHLACLVPAFRLDPAGRLVDAWDPGVDSVALPVYDSWSFTTVADFDDFTSISRRLEPLSKVEWDWLHALSFGTASVRYRLPQAAEGVVLPTGAALTLVPKPGGPPPDPVDADPAVRTDLGALAAAALVAEGRWVLGMPRYDEPWPQPPGALPPGARGWPEELTDDPRRRGVAGLGAWAAIEWQDRISDAAADQAGAVAAAAERVRHLVLGLAAARSLWARRVPTDPLERLWLLGPTMAKLPADTGASVLAALADQVPALAAVRSGAARRTLRRGTTAARLARPGAVEPSAILAAANRCPSSPPGGGDVLPRVKDWLGKAGPAERLASERELDKRTQDPLDSRRLTDFEPPDADLVGEQARVAVDELVERLRPNGPPLSSCRPLADLAAVGRLVAGACDPTVADPAAMTRVRGTVHGLPEPWLKPPDLTPELDLPLSVFLTERAPDWLLPGVGDLPMDRAVGAASSPVFIEALLVGANHRATGELRWRNLPVVTGWTPLRRFWNRVGSAGPITDIDGIVDIAKLRAGGADWLRWPAGTRLGDPSHRPDSLRGADFVVLFHTPLFHRYPATVVRLVAAQPPGGPPDWTRDPSPGDAVDPTFKGHIGPDVTFFGFPVDPSAGRDHWVVVEEPPPGYRFWSPGENGTLDWAPAGEPAPEPADAFDGAKVAAAALVRPVRVLLGRLVEA